MPFIITIFSVSCSNVETTKNQIIEEDNNESITADDFFPKLDVIDYYDFVKFDEQAQPVISDKFIMKVIEDVVLRVSSSKGEIKFSVVKYSPSTVDFNFEWTYLDTKLYKTYSFEIR